MIETILIFFQILFIGVLIFYSIPLTANFSFNSVTLPNLLAIKSIIFLNILLLFSILNINPIYIFILTFGSLIFLIFKSKNIFSINLKINYFLIYFYIFVISIVMANHLEFAWDAKFFWFLKTINFFQENSLVNLDKLPATDYPHLGTYVWSFFWKFPFNNYEYLGRIFYIFFYVICIFSFCELFKTNNVNKFILSSLIILMTYNHELFSGNQEILVFSLVLITTKLCHQILNNQKENQYLNIILILLSFNAALWIKNEGFFLVGFILFLTFILGKFHLNEKILFLLASLFLIIFRLIIFYSLDTNLESFEFEKTLSSNFADGLFSDIKTIVFYSLVYTFSLPVILLGLILMLVNVYTFKSDKTQIFIIFYTLLNILFIFVAFLFSMENVEWQVRVGLKRVMFESSGFYLLTSVYLFNKIQGK